MNSRILLLTIALLSVVVFLFSGCTFVKEKIADFKLPGGTHLDYEEIWAGHNLMMVDENPQIAVVTDNHTPIPWLPTSVETKNIDLEKKVQSVDFSHYFLVIIYHGVRSQSGFDIQTRDVWQNGNTVFVKAHFKVPEGDMRLMAFTEPYRILKVDKQKMPQFGELTFKLYDDLANEKAATEQSISAPVK